MKRVCELKLGKKHCLPFEMTLGLLGLLARLPGLIECIVLQQGYMHINYCFECGIYMHVKLNWDPFFIKCLHQSFELFCLKLNHFQFFLCPNLYELLIYYWGWLGPSYIYYPNPFIIHPSGSKLMLSTYLAINCI